MPTYSEIGAELGHLDGAQTIAWLPDQIRQTLRSMSQHTGRPVVVYEANHRAATLSSLTAQMDVKDLEFFMDVLKGLRGDELDLILNSYGGSPDAADMIGSYLRQKFSSIRVFVPVEAMSAATMLACSANKIVMGKHSFLGPIDLQLVFVTADGPRACAAQDVLDQFNTVRKDFSGKSEIRSFWDGPGARYWPDSIIRCQNALSYGREVAERGLFEVMFRGDPEAKTKARTIAADLADHKKHRAHGRRLSRTYLHELGMKIGHLEDDQALQDLVLTVHHLFSHWFEIVPGIAKTLYSSEGRFAFDLDTSTYVNSGQFGPKDAWRLLYQVMDEPEEDESEKGESEKDEPEKDEPEKGKSEEDKSG